MNPENQNNEEESGLELLRKDLRQELDEQITNHPSLQGLTSQQKNDVYRMTGGFLLGALALLGLSGYYIVSNISRDAATNISASIVADKLQSRDEFIQNVGDKTISLTKGAVVAYRLPGGCPSGWVEYVAARGRTIVGVNKDFKFQEQGGAAEHYLSDEEMPAHNHSYQKLGVFGEVAMTEGEGVSVYEQITENTDPLVGESAAHNNMPPYVALYLCEKQ